MAIYKGTTEEIIKAMNGEVANVEVVESNQPALLFTNNNGKWGEILLFQKYGVSQNNSIEAISDITTNYVENNTSIQDHWAIKPVQYTLSGLVGEVIFREPNKFSSFLQEKVLNFIEPLGILSPTVSNYMRGAINITKQVEANYQKYLDIGVNMFNASVENNLQITNTKQAELYQLLEKLRINRQLVNVWTPFKTFNNMAITRISMRQSSESKYQSTIEVDFIEWRDRETILRQATDTETNILRNATVAMQKENVLNSGNVTGKETSFIEKIFGWITKGK